MDPKPNFILGVVDDASDFGTVEGMPEVMQALEYGCRFTNSFTEFPLCAPSRATAFTGLCAHNHGVTGNIRKTRAEWVQTFDKSIVKTLRDGGYRTVLVGVKSLNGFNGDPDIIGFTDWHVLDDHEGATRYFDPEIDHNGTVEQHQGYSTDILADIARAEISRAAADGVPLYLYLAFAAPHAPALPGPEFEGASDGLQMPRSANFNEADRSDKPFWIRDLPAYDTRKADKVEQAWRERRDCMRSVSKAWERILATVANVTSPTYAVLTSDNGYMQGAHANTGKLLGAYDESTRVFLLWWECIGGRWDHPDGVLPVGRKRSAYVSNVDVPATLLDLAGLVHDGPLDGKSLLPVLASNNAPWRTHLGIQAAWSTGDEEDVDPAKQSFCVYTKGFRYCYHVGPGIDGVLEEMYDIRPDRSPDGANADQQLTNVAGWPEYASRQRRLRRMAEDLAVCSGPECFVEDDDS